MREIPLADVYRLIEPGPVVLLATARRGRPNVMAMSWHMMMEFTPPLIGCIVSSRNHSFATLRATKEAVIAIPEAGLARSVVGVGNCSGRDTDKFAAFGLATAPAAEVSPPLLPDCFANLECRVSDTRMVRRYNMFVLEVARAWASGRRRRPETIHHAGWGRFVIDGETIRLASAKP